MIRRERARYLTSGALSLLLVIRDAEVSERALARVAEHLVHALRQVVGVGVARVGHAAGIKGCKHNSKFVQRQAAELVATEAR